VPRKVKMSMNEQLELNLGKLSPIIDMLGLTPRQTRILKGKSICTIACLVKVSEDSYSSLSAYVLRHKFFNRKTLTKIMEKLDELEIAYNY